MILKYKMMKDKLYQCYKLYKVKYQMSNGDIRVTYRVNMVKLFQCIWLIMVLFLLNNGSTTQDYKIVVVIR